MKKYKELNEIDILETQVEGLKHNLAWYKSENTKYKILIGLLIVVAVLEAAHILL